MKLNIKKDGNPIDNYIYSVRKLSLSKNLFWIRSMIRANKILVYENGSNPELTTDNKRHILNVYRVIGHKLNAIYGNDWDMHVERMSNNKFRLSPIIRFKHVDIVNSEGDEHHIQDLIMALQITFVKEGDIIRQELRLLGTRLTLTKAEADSTYLHSHLNSRSMQNSNDVLEAIDFCLGDGEMADILSVLSYEFTEEEFELFVHTCQSVAEWESIEGVPYMHINQIVANNGPARTINLNSRILQEEHGHRVLRHINEISTLNLYLDKHLFKVKPDEVLVKKIKEIMISTNNYDFLVKQSGDGRLVSWISSSGDNDVSHYNHPDKFIIFSGEELPFKVIAPEDEGQQDIEDYQPDKKIVEYVTKEIQMGFSIAQYQQAVRSH